MRLKFVEKHDAAIMPTSPEILETSLVRLARTSDSDPAVPCTNQMHNLK
jgi:hypothetical protein